MTGPECCRQEAAPSAAPMCSASAARRHMARTHYHRAVGTNRRGRGSAPARKAIGEFRRGGRLDCRSATTGGFGAGGGSGLATGCGPSAAARANSGGHVQRRNRPRRAPDGLIAGGSAARRLGGSAARRLGGSAARRLGGSAARRLGGSAARRLGGSAARRLGGSAARRLGGSAAHYNHFIRHHQPQEALKASFAAPDRVNEIAPKVGAIAIRRPRSPLINQYRRQKKQPDETRASDCGEPCMPNAMVMQQLRNIIVACRRPTCGCSVIRQSTASAPA